MLRLLNSAAQKREVKATQNLSIIVAFFMICWLPLYTINCINAFCRECFINESFTYFGIILSHLNSAINPLLYAYHLKDFRGALVRLFTCAGSEQDAFYRPSVMSLQQHRINTQNVQRRSFQPRIYIDSPVWKRTPRARPLESIDERKIPNDSENPQWSIELSNSAPSDSHHHPSPELHRNQSSQINIFIISHSSESEIVVEPQNSSLYRIANRNQEVSEVD